MPATCYMPVRKKTPGLNFKFLVSKPADPKPADQTSGNDQSNQLSKPNSGELQSHNFINDHEVYFSSNTFWHKIDSFLFNFFFEYHFTDFYFSTEPRNSGGFGGLKRSESAPSLGEATDITFTVSNDEADDSDPDDVAIEVVVDPDSPTDTPTLVSID